MGLCSGLFLVAFFGAGFALPQVKINKDGLFEGDDGRVLVFHGANYVNKDDDMIRLSDEDLGLVSKDMGFNIARVGFLWNLLEIAPGVYNWTYLAEMEKTVTRFADHGMYSILDMHQDIWSPLYCGHGIPSFYAYPYNNTWYQKGGLLTFPKPFASPRYPTDKPDELFPQILNCEQARQDPFGWSRLYGTFALSAAVQRLYSNDSGILDRFGDMWELVARRFYNHSGVLGYELLNEPWSGDVWKKPWLLWEAKADTDNLKHMNEYLHSRIRAFDNQKIIFFESATGGNLGMPIGYEEGPGGVEYNDRQALSHHIYCPPTISDKVAKNKWVRFFEALLVDGACRLEYHWLAQKRLREIKRLGCGGLLTEFASISSKSVGKWSAISELHDTLDQVMAGWIYWEFSYRPTGLASFVQQPQDSALAELPDEIILVHLTRTYAKKIAGKPIGMHFDQPTAVFALTYEPHQHAENRTEIYYNQPFFYPNDAVCNLQPPEAANCTTDKSRNIITVEHNPSAVGQTLTVTVSPAKA